MAKTPIIPPHCVITANRLHDGAVVFLTADDRWTEAIEAARIAHSAETPELLAAAGCHVGANRIVGPYVVGVEPTASGPHPLRLRERIRAAGPTVDIPVARQES